MDRFKGTDDYITSAALRDAVNVAVSIGRPLLIKGEPGTGKTRLAHSIAAGLGMELIVWNIKSTSRAADGLYVYDTVARLHDSRFGDRDVSDIRQYIRLGKLGEAFCRQERTVLLIDEIDKADIEFPNDLLHELDAMSFHIPETGDTHTATQRPVVVVTSNAEKDLPDAFLRRCVFYYIEFPDPELMVEIVGVHFPDLAEKLLAAAISRFYWLREFDDLKKKPSTSELLDWVQALVAGGVPADRVEQELPYLGVLLKKPADVQLVRRKGIFRNRGAF